MTSLSNPSADGALRAAAMLTETIVRSQLQFVSPDDMKPFVMNVFRDVLDELMGHKGAAASLEQITSGREPLNP